MPIIDTGKRYEFQPSYVDTYTPENRIVHHVSVDFKNRNTVPDAIHIVQYDNEVPIVEVTLLEANEPFTLMETDCVNVRCHKPDNTFVYNPALGCTPDRKKVYIEVTQQMAAAHGMARAIVELTRGSAGVAGTASFFLQIDKNPASEEAIESTDEFKTLIQYLDDAAMFATLSKSWAIGDTGIREDEDTNNSLYWSRISESWTQGGTELREGEDLNNANYWSRISESWAQGGTELREGEDTDNSEYWAKYSRSFAKGDNNFREGEETDSSEYYYKMSRSYAVGDNNMREGEETDNSKWYSEESNRFADLSEDSAVKSESYAVGGTGSRNGEDTDNSEYYSKMSKSWAVGDTGVRDSEDSDNSEYYSKVARNASKSAAKYYLQVKELANTLWFDYDGTMADLGEEQFILIGTQTKERLKSICSKITSITFCRKSDVPNGAVNRGGLADCTVYEETGGLIYIANDAYINTTGSVEDMFSGLEELNSVDFGTLSISTANSLRRLFADDPALTYIDFSTISTRNVESFESMFENCTGLEEIDLSVINTSFAETFKKMFKNCSSLQLLDLGSFVTTFVTDMSYMFADCEDLESVAISSFDTAVVGDMSHMFENCTSLVNVDMSNWDLSSLSDATRMFYNMPGCTTIETPLELDIDILLPDEMYAQETVPGLCEVNQKFVYLPKDAKTSVTLKTKKTDGTVDLNAFEASTTIFFGGAMSMMSNFTIR